LDLANFQQSPPATGGAHGKAARGRKVDVIYCRYSSELQRSESIKDQERRCRDGWSGWASPTANS
jgi:hypothetical protein